MKHIEYKMGIKGFNKAITCYNKIKLADLSGFTLAIDASGEIYRAALGMGSVNQLTDAKGNSTVYIKVLLSVIRNLFEYNIKQIWVFDNPVPHPLKLVLAERVARRAKATAALSKSESKDEHDADDAADVEDVKYETKIEPCKEKFVIDDDTTEDTPAEVKAKLEKQEFCLNAETVGNVMRILDAFMIPYIIAPPGIEAEHVAAQLTIDGKADAVLTNDADALLFGATRVVMRDRTKDGRAVKSGGGQLLDYHLQVILTKYGLTIKKLRYLGVVLGCDFYIDKPEPTVVPPGTDPDDVETDDRPLFRGIGPKSVISKLHTLMHTYRIKNNPHVKAALGVFEEQLPEYKIEHANSLLDTPGNRPFRSSKKINQLLKWLIEDLGFNAKQTVDKFRETYGLEKIRYVKPESAG